MSTTENLPSHFIKDIIVEDLHTGKHEKIATRFPPEPNGYLHIGHAKSICLNFGLALEFAGTCNLRFDDTNPCKEDVEYVDSIKRDVQWLGFDWDEREYYASDYFEQMYQYALHLIRQGKAYVCHLTADEIRDYRGTLTQAGRESPYRNRSVDENITLFEQMRSGRLADGTCVLRAKIDMTSPNINMRDPAIYRIRKAEHHRTGDRWCIYPMYDFAHCISDAIEGITHSICTLEFEIHRPLYDWYLDQLPVSCHPRQIEFARLNLTFTVMSKRKLLELVRSGIVKSWDDPRMPTLAGMRRRGYTPEAIRNFCEIIGVAKTDSTVEVQLLEHCVREDLNRRAPRVMAVLHPIKVVIDNYPDDQVEWLDAINNPEDPDQGMRKIPFSKVLYIEEDDFRETPPPKYHRLYPGNEVRLKAAYYITCTHLQKDETGAVTEVHCTYDPATRGGTSSDGRKVKGTSHWVSAAHALDAEVRQYNHLFTAPNPGEEEGVDFCSQINPDSLEVLTSCKVEPSLNEAAAGSYFQFERIGYYNVDPDSRKDALVFNRTLSLKDTWAKLDKTKK